MKYRNIELYYQQTLDNVGTKIIDLRTTDPISAIRLNFSGTNDATHNKSNFINDVITKIELVDGSDQLISMTMKEAQALQYRLTGKMPHMRPGESGGGGQEESVTLMFGRYLWDPEYYMDLTKFRNPQLKITTNISAVRTTGTNSYATGTLKVTIDLLVIEEGAAAAKGFLMQKNIYGFTSGTSGDEHVDMPLDYPYVGLMVRAYAVGMDIDENIKKIKINCDAGKFIPIEKQVKDLYRWEEEELGAAELRYFLYRKDNETVYHVLNHDPIVSVIGRDAADIINVNTCWSGAFVLRFYDIAGAAITTEELLPFIVKGSCPHSTVFMPFGLLSDPATYFDPKTFGDIDLVIEQDNVSAVDIILCQLRGYAVAA